jgi:hypothetical protein
LLAGALSVGALPGCRCGSDSDGTLAAAAPSAAASRPPVDRLAPGELTEGKATAYGLVLPRQLQIERRFPDAVHAAGIASPEAVSNFVRQRVEVSHVEIGAARTVFPVARIKGGDTARSYRIDVVADGPTTRLVVRDVTPPPTPEGLSEEERWRRAGMTPDGQPLNPKQLQ